MKSGVRLVRVDGREFLSEGPRVIAFAEKHCVFTNGRWTRQRVKLLPWQKRSLCRVFEITPETMLRRYRRALIGTPRKAGKTELAAMVALYLMIGDEEPSAETYAAASAEEQADRVFEAARRMCEMSPTLSQLVDVEQGKLWLRGDPYSYFERLTAKGSSKHGLNIHGVVLDEVHAWLSDQHQELWAALTTGMAAREQPLMFMITTAGSDLETSRCGALYEYGRELEAGKVDDPGFYFEWHEAPKNVPHSDPKSWECNPSLGVTVSHDFLRGELAGTNVGEDGKRRGAITVGEFRRLYLNQWVDYGDKPWVTDDQLDACQLDEFTLDPERPTWVGVDLSESMDSAAVNAGQLWDGDDRPCGHTDEPCLYMTTRLWERPRRDDGTYQEDWEVSNPEVKEHIRTLNAELTVVSNVFDPWHSKLMRQDLEALGLMCEEIWQTGARRSGSSAAFYDLIAQRRCHFWQPELRAHLANATAVPTGKEGGYYLGKRNRRRKMDAAMAGVNVVYGFTFHPAPVRKRVKVTWA